jgi:hypothetical protein
VDAGYNKFPTEKKFCVAVMSGFLLVFGGSHAQTEPELKAACTVADTVTPPRMKLNCTAEAPMNSASEGHHRIKPRVSLTKWGDGRTGHANVQEFLTHILTAK